MPPYGFISHRTQKDSHVQNGPLTHHGRRSAPSTHPPTKPLLHTAEQQCSSSYIRTAVQQYVQQYTPGTRGAVSWLVLMKQETEKKTPTYRTAHPPTTDDAVHPPPTHRPNFYYIQENSSAAVRTSEQ